MAIAGNTGRLVPGHRVEAARRKDRHVWAWSLLRFLYTKEGERKVRRSERTDVSYRQRGRERLALGRAQGVAGHGLCQRQQTGKFTCK